MRMATSIGAVLLLAAHTSAAVSAASRHYYSSSEPPVGRAAAWSPDIAELFVPAERAAVESRRRGQPILVLITLPYSLALQQSVNTGSLVRSLLLNLVTVHVMASELNTDAVKALLGTAERPSYFPAAYFFAPGGAALLRMSPSARAFPRAFDTDAELGTAMREALTAQRMESSRHSRWWLAGIILLFAVLLVVPTCFLMVWLGAARRRKALIGEMKRST